MPSKDWDDSGKERRGWAIWWKWSFYCRRKSWDLLVQCRPLQRVSPLDDNGSEADSPWLLGWEEWVRTLYKRSISLSLSFSLSLSIYIYIYIYTYSGVNRLLVSLHPQQYTLYRNKWYIAVSIASLSVSHAQYRIRQDALRHWWHCNPWLQLSSAGFDWARARCLESLAGFDWARALAALIEMEP